MMSPSTPGHAGSPATPKSFVPGRNITNASELDELPPQSVAPRSIVLPATVATFNQTLMHSKKEELMLLAKKLGETHVSKDLSMLLQFKYECDKNRQRQLRKTTNSDGKPVTAADTPLQMKPAYRIKVDILHLLSTLAATAGFKKLAQSPVNLLYTDLLLSYINLSFNDRRFRGAIFRVLDHLAWQVEIEHRVRWNRLTKDMDFATKRRSSSHVYLFVPNAKIGSDTRWTCSCGVCRAAC